MYLEEALERLQVIIGEIENKQLPLHEVMKLHEEGQKLVKHADGLLRDAKERLKVTEVDVDSPVDEEESISKDGDADESENPTDSLF